MSAFEDAMENLRLKYMSCSSGEAVEIWNAALDLAAKIATEAGNKHAYHNRMIKASACSGVANLIEKEKV